MNQQGIRENIDEISMNENILNRENVVLILDYHSYDDHRNQNSIQDREERKWFLYSDWLFKKNRKYSAFLKLFGYLRDLPRLALLFEDEPLLLMKALEVNELVFEYMPDYLKQDEECILRLIERNPFVLKRLEYSYRNNLKVLSRAVSLQGYCLAYAPSELAKNRELSLLAVKNCGKALIHSRWFINDREVVLEAIKNDGSVLGSVPTMFQCDEEIVREAVKSYGLSLKYATTFCSNTDIVREAVSNNGLALEFASEEIKENKEIAMLAINQNYLAFKFCSANLQHDEELIKMIPIIEENPVGNMIENVTSLKLATSRRANRRRASNISREVLLNQIRNNVKIIITREFAQDIEFVREAVNINGLMLKFVGSSIQERDTQIILDAIRNNGLALKYVCMKKSQNREFILEAAKQLIGKETLACLLT